MRDVFYQLALLGAVTAAGCTSPTKEGPPTVLIQDSEDAFGSDADAAPMGDGEAADAFATDTWTLADSAAETSLSETSDVTPPGDAEVYQPEACLVDADCDVGTCQGGTCTPPLGCDSDKQCTPEGVCDLAAGVCVECLAATDCPDDYTCVEDTCTPPTLTCQSSKDCGAYQVCDKAIGSCVECVQPADCEAMEACVDSVCEPLVCIPGGTVCSPTGLVVTCNTSGTGYGNEATCAQLHPCTADAVCMGGACVGGAAVPGCCLASADCDDENSCTVDACVNGACVSAPVTAPGCCMEDDDCPGTGTTCTPNVCTAFQCTPGPPLSCDDGDPCTHDTCVQGGCLHMPSGEAGCCDVAADCDDGNECTVDACLASACTSVPNTSVPGCCGTALDCEDENPCTESLCVDFHCAYPAGDACAPGLTITVPNLDFGPVSAGATKTLPVTLKSTGGAALLVYSLQFQGHPDFRLAWGETVWEPGQAITIEPPIALEPGETATFQLSYTPLTGAPAEAALTFYTNDASAPSGSKVTATANTEGPAIDLDPSEVQFGGKLVGKKALLPVEINSVGTADLVITSAHFSEDSDADFSLDFSTVPGYEDLPSGPTEENPLTIPVNSKVTFNVVYIPSVTSPLGENGQPVLDKGFLVVESNAFNSEIEIAVTGLGVDTDCPTALATIQEGEQVIPQTVLHLFGDQSFAPAGAIASWEWSVQQPSGSASVFIPSAQFPNPTFEVNTAGEYVFRLDVYDENGEKSCVPAVRTVLVIPDEAIHVELLWHTPNDPDETDEGPEAGSDVDLHFVHDAYAVSGPDLDGDGAPDPWFDQPFDCFWFNAHPNWGSFDPSIDDDPGLDRDDTNGAGPENLNLNIPENVTYRVGVHYWSDHEYGDSLVTVRIYIYSNLVFEVEDVQLSNHDMWNMATIDWPSGKVTLVQGEGGGYKITPDYQPTGFFN